MITPGNYLLISSPRSAFPLNDFISSFLLITSLALELFCSLRPGGCTDNFNFSYGSAFYDMWKVGTVKSNSLEPAGLELSSPGIAAPRKHWRGNSCARLSQNNKHHFLALINSLEDVTASENCTDTTEIGGRDQE